LTNDQISANETQQEPIARCSRTPPTDDNPLSDGLLYNRDERKRHASASEEVEEETRLQARIDLIENETKEQRVSRWKGEPLTADEIDLLKPGRRRHVSASDPEIPESVARRVERLLSLQEETLPQARVDATEDETYEAEDRIEATDPEDEDEDAESPDPEDEDDDAESPDPEDEDD
jgi:hypothetical protein